MSSRTKEAQQRLLEVLKKNKRDYYRCDGIEAWIDHGTDKAKAKPIEAPQAEEAE